MVGEEIGRKTLGVVGFGASGRRVAALARRLGMRVLAYNRSAIASAAAPGVVFEALDNVLRHSDYVSIHLALQDGTRGLIGERELALMKPGAYLVNTARGAIVDEKALHRALVEERLRGAALDVFGEEPPRANPLVGLPQVITSPHLGGNTTQGFGRTSDAVVDSLISCWTASPPRASSIPKSGPPPHPMGGGLERRPTAAPGATCSNAAAACGTSVSACQRPTIWSAAGNPSDVKPQGTLAAGWSLAPTSACSALSAATPSDRHRAAG